MKCTIDNILDLQAFVDLVYDSVTNIELEFDETGLNISMLNKARVCFYCAKYTIDYFTEYTIDGHESVLIDSKELFKILKTCKGNDTLGIETNTHSIIFSINPNSENYRIFEVSQVDGEYNNPKPPVIDGTTRVIVLLDDLKQAVEDMGNIVETDQFKLVLNNGELIVTAPNDALVKYNNVLVNGVEGEGYVIVNSEYLKSLTKLKKVNTDVEFHIGNNTPLCWNINSFDGFVLLEGMIAPILEDN